MRIEISNGKNKIYDNRFLLREKGFDFIKRSYGKSFYSKTTNSPTEKEEIELLCNEKGLSFRCIEEKHIRSSNYRKTYIGNMGFKHKYTICGYCGLPLQINKLTVDHIIPVDKVQKSNYAKWALQKMNIDDVNDMKNLVGACRRCNSKKRAKMGVWVALGFLGKNKVLWCFRWILRVIVIILLAIYGIPLLCDYL